jgi:hypothetical protein
MHFRELGKQRRDQGCAENLRRRKPFNKARLAFRAMQKISCTRRGFLGRSPSPARSNMPESALEIGAGQAARFCRHLDDVACRSTAERVDQIRRELPGKRRSAEPGSHIGFARNGVSGNAHCLLARDNLCIWRARGEQERAARNGRSDRVRRQRGKVVCAWSWTPAKDSAANEPRPGGRVAGTPGGRV